MKAYVLPITVDETGIFCCVSLEIWWVVSGLPFDYVRRNESYNVCHNILKRAWKDHDDSRQFSGREGRYFPFIVQVWCRIWLNQIEHPMSCRQFSTGAWCLVNSSKHSIHLCLDITRTTCRTGIMNVSNYTKSSSTQITQILVYCNITHQWAGTFPLPYWYDVISDPVFMDTFHPWGIYVSNCSTTPLHLHCSLSVVWLYTVHEQHEDVVLRCKYEFHLRVSDPGVQRYSGSPSQCNCLASTFRAPRRCASETSWSICIACLSIKRLPLG